MSRGFEDLEIWERAHKPTVYVCRVFIDCRFFALRGRILRTAISVPSKIAERAERNFPAEFARFVGIARGPLGELRSQLMIAWELAVATGAELETYLRERADFSHILYAFTRSLKTPDVLK
ncbi:MAG: four helix bundle protein [Candidatus Methylacidiphilales bacterium]|nr:four helix bundle protein [Candidatus Methylacidiphilales bacterium]